MSPRRQALWARAAALDVADDPALSPRARRLAQRSQAPLAFDDLLAAPDWLAWEAPQRARLAILAGAAAVAPAWRRSVDGAVLRRAGGVLGEPVLDALLAAPDGGPAADDREAQAAEPEALARLGRAALAAEVPERAALTERLARLLDARPWPQVAPAAIQARALLAQFGDAS